MIRLQRKTLCLDWDKRSLRLVLAKIGVGQIRLEDAHAVRIGANVDANDPRALGAFLTQTLQRYRVQHRRVAVDVPRDRAVINRLKLPPTPAAELAAAVRFQAMRELPYPVDEAEIDFVVMGRDEQGLATDVLLAAVRRETLVQIRQTCEAAGLTPVRIGLRPYANLVSVSRLPGTLDQRVLFVDVGPTQTEINIFRGRSLAFSRAASVSVPFSFGEMVTEDSRVSSKAELEEVERAAAVEQEVVGELLVEMTRTLQAYRATETDATIDQIIIAGGTGLEHALLEAAETRFGVPIAMFDPTMTLGAHESEAGKLRAFSAALGLAWGLSREGLLEIDFLNPKKPVPPRASLQRRARLAGLGAGAALALLAGYVVVDRVSLNRRLANIERTNDALLEDVARIVQIDILSREAQDWESVAGDAAWLDPLLDLTEQMIEPGKRMIVANASGDIRRGLLTLQLFGGEQACGEFVEKINALRVDGKPVYRAKRGKWQSGQSIDPRFGGREDIPVELVDLQAVAAGLKERDKSRTSLLKKYGATIGGKP